MENLIKWLMRIEGLANDIYSQAAVYFENNPQLREFLVRSAEHEALHYHIMTKVAHLYQTIPHPPQAISVDLETRNEIEKTVVNIREQLVAGSLTETIILDKITTAEFSEWNDIFIYVVSYLKEQDNELKYAVAEIQTHLRYIENFLENTEYGRGLLGKIRDVPMVWRENILIVEDNFHVSQLLAAVLHREGDIDIAGNGEEAIRKIKDKYYKLVVSDVDMPIMDGFTFYGRAVEMFPGIKDRFIFLTGDHSRERLDFFKGNRLRFLLKPASIRTIRDETLKVLLG